MKILHLRKFCLGLTFLVLLIGLPKTGWPHLLRFSSSEIQVKDSKIDWILKIHLEDFDRKFAQVEESLIRDYVSQRLSVLLGGKECTLEDFSIEKDVPQQTVTLPLVYSCPAPGSDLQISYGLFFGDLDHKHLLNFKQGARILSFTFSPENTEASFSTTSSLWLTVRDFLHLGLEHILLGFDHVLFVLSLLLGARRFKTLFWLVTSFTIAHSITLALATLNIFQLTPKFVEPAIAASIAFVALRHLFFGDIHKTGGDLIVTFFFGLIHGMGFSTVLKEVGIPSGEIVVPLLSFNGGVEMGQILIIGAVYPITVFLHRKWPDAYTWIRRISLILITGMAVYWFIERVFFAR